MSSAKETILKSDRMNAALHRRTPPLEQTQGEDKRARRKPNFSAQERLHLARSYVEHYEEFNRGFTAATKGEAKIGRQRLLQRWAAELTSFGVVERTPVEIEQKLRDYMKKIAANRKRAIKRAMSPACELINTVVPETSAVEDSTANDSLTAYAGFLLQQHRATHQDSSTNLGPLELVINSYDNEEVKSKMDSIPIIKFGPENGDNKSHKRKASAMIASSNNEECSLEPLKTKEYHSFEQTMRSQRLEISRAELELINANAEVARKTLELKEVEVEMMKVKLEIKKLEREAKGMDVKKMRLEMEQQRETCKGSSNETSGTGAQNTPSNRDEQEVEL